MKKEKNQKAKNVSEKKHESNANNLSNPKPNTIYAEESDDEIDGSKPIGKAHGRLNDVHEGNREKYDKSLKEIHE